jgi:dsDNA-specific endonuclease/ATPase MutS2
MMKFEIGEEVSFLYEKGEGKIVKILSKNEVLLVDDFGFEQTYDIKFLVKKIGKSIQEKMNVPLKDEEFKPKHKKHSVIQDKTTKKDYWELDLHIEQLTDVYRGLSNFEILSIQLRAFKNFLARAKANNIQKLVIIHGVGEGILKNEIRNHLASLTIYDFFDASYLEYGKGATEIRLKFQ